MNAALKAVLSLAAAAALSQTALATAAFAADAPACKVVRMSDPGWTDITSTNALFGVVVEALGYEQKVNTLAVPVTFEGLKIGELDVFLGNWMPVQARFVEPLVASGDMVVVKQNLDGIRFTLAVPKYVADAGVTDFKDLAPNAEKFGSKIYSIEAGSAVNQTLTKMVDQGDHGLKGWDIVESSEQGMLGQVKRAEGRDEWVVFPAWEPHPMNTNHELVYLTGGDKEFGPNFGSSSVHTVVRKGFTEDCPNLTKLLTQLTFTVDMENEIMGEILDNGTDPNKAALAYLKANPAVVEPWVAGVTTFDGGDGAAAVKEKLGL
jgi:glycine betaine/proline transport system substrate-binding protein